MLLPACGDCLAGLSAQAQKPLRSARRYRNLMNQPAAMTMIDPVAIAAAREKQMIEDSRARFIANDLQADFDDLAKKWQPIHRRMADDERRFNDSQEVATDTKDRSADGAGQNREAPTLAITFSRTIITAARRADMLLPNNDNHGEVQPDDCL